MTDPSRVGSMATAVLLHLPDDAQRFEPVARRLPGTEFLLGAGRWVPARRDSRRATERWLRRRGYVPVDRPEPRFDVILATPAGTPAAVSRWLAPGGRVVVWQDGWIRSRFLIGLESPNGERPASVEYVIDPVVTRVCVPTFASAAGLDPERVRAVGDPRLDAFVDVGAAARARGALGLREGGRVGLVLLDRIGSTPAWARAIAALRADAELLLRPTTLQWLESDPSGDWPRALTGPGLRLCAPDGDPELAELLALADFVVAEPGPDADAAVACGRPTVLVGESEAQLRERARGHDAGRVSVESEAPGRLPCTEPSRLHETVRAVLDPRRSGHAVRAPWVDGDAAARLAGVLAEFETRRRADSLTI